MKGAGQGSRNAFGAREDGEQSQLHTTRSFPVVVVLVISSHDSRPQSGLCTWPYPRTESPVASLRGARHPSPGALLSRFQVAAEQSARTPRRGTRTIRLRVEKSLLDFL